MIRLIFLLFTIICFTIPYIIFFKYKFGKALPLAFISITFLLFICSLLNNFSLFKYFVVVVDLLIIIFVFVQYNKVKNNIYAGLFRYSTLIFIIIYIFLYFILKERMYVYVDDYGFWGLLVRNGIKNNSLYAPNSSYRNIGSYPPFLTLLEISFCKLLGVSDAVDGISMLAVSCFVISLFMNLLDRYELKISIKPILVSLIIVACTLTISSNDEVGAFFLYNTTLIDWSMGFLFAYCMYVAFNSNGLLNDSINLGMCCAALILTKQVSLPLTILVLVMYFFMQLVNKKLDKKILISIMLPIIIYFIWQIQVKLSFNATPLVNSVGTVGRSMNLLEDQTSKTIIGRFITAFFTKPIIKHPINLSFFSVLILVTIVIILLGVFCKEKKYYILGTFVFLGGLGYSLMMLFSYVSVFNYVDGMTLVCYGRYMQTYTLGALTILPLLFVNKCNNIKQYFIIFLVLCLFVEPASISTLQKTYMEDNRYYNFKNTFINFYNYTYNNEKTVVLYSTGIAGIGLINYVMDKKNEHFDIFNSIDNGDSCEEFVERLQGAKYLIVVDSNDDFWKNCYHLFQDEFILDESIYTVNFDENGDVFLLRL